LAARNEVRLRRWLAALRQLGLPGYTRVQNLAISLVPQDNIGFPCEKCALCLTVECREITLFQGLGRGQRSQRCDHARKLTVEVVARSASDFGSGAVLRGAVGRPEGQNAERGEQQTGQDQCPAEREQVGP
jgi:hypothetical protein